MTPWKTGEYPKYAAFIHEAEFRHDIPRDLLARILNYDAETIAADRRNALGAVGIAQLTPEDCDHMGFHPDSRTDPHASIIAAARHLCRMRRIFGSWANALLAFRWGADYVRRMINPEPGEIVPVIPRMIAADIEKIRADVRVPS